jgi:hypothetical protein
MAKYIRKSKAVSISEIKKKFALEDEQLLKSPSKAQQLEEMQQPLTSDQIKEMEADLEHFADIVGSVDVAEPTRFTRDELNSLMQEFLAKERVGLIVTARHERIRKMVFDHMDQVRESIIEVGNKKFCREGGGTGEPTINKDLLKSRLGDDYEKVVKRTTIPAKIVEEVDEALLGEYLQTNPDRIEDVRDSLVVGLPKTPKFRVRDIDSGELPY